LKLLRAEFVTSAADGGAELPKDGVPHVAFVGRSNVGKSSLINALARRSIARTSAAPGKTRLANVYRLRVDGGPGGPGRWDVYLVDLPGYGYARGEAARRAREEGAGELAAVAEAYLSGAAPELVLLLVDARHPGLDSDRQAFGWLAELRGAPGIVATKIDKLTRAERARNLKTLEETFGTAALPVSAASGEGLDALWTKIAKTVRRADRRG
jgi:GTP-binding protein